MATRTQKAKVGLFLLACLTLIVVSIAVISGYYQQQGTEYTVQFEESVAGLYEGAPVMYLGVPVGKVTGIRVAEATNKPTVEIVIDPEKVQLYQGVEAQLVLYSLAAGTMAISLEGGDPEAGELPPGVQIAARPSALEAISTEIEDIVASLSDLTDAVGRGLEGLEEGAFTELVDEVKVTLDDTQTFLENGNEAVSEVTTTIRDFRDDTRKLIEEFTKVSEDVQPLIKDLDTLSVTANRKLEEFDVDATESELNRTLKNIADLTERVNAAMEKIDEITAHAMHEADNIQHTMRSALNSMGEALYSMRTFVEQLQQDPASLLRGRAEVEEPS